MRRLSATNICTLCAVLSCFSHVQLCNPMDCRLPGSSVHGILQARILEWVAMSSSRGSSQPRDQTHLPYTPPLEGGFFTTNATAGSLCTHSIHSVAQSCPALCDPMNHTTPGLPVHHQLPEFTQTHVHQVGDAIQPSHPLSSEVIDISPGNLDSSLCFFQTSVSHDVLCI